MSGRRLPLSEPRRHVVVFDVNVYLDVASLVGAPFTWEKFGNEAVGTARAIVPHPVSAAYDSLRAAASCTSGLLAGLETLQVFTSNHIDRLVRSKAMQSTTPDPATGYRGLGWSRQAADSLVSTLIGGLTEKSSGGTVGDAIPDGNPPLDHEDGMVFGACRRLAGDDPLCTVYCVTRDREFREAYRAGRLGSHTRVLSPARFVQLVRAARGVDAMPGPRAGA